jgi:hypothetical protein
LLYTPPEQRAAMNCLLALTGELGAARAQPLEPSVAEARLSWWRFEAQRYAAGKPQHPWLLGLPAAIDLATLVEAAAADGTGAALYRALFLAAAALLGAAPLTPAARAGLEQLATQVWRSEHAAPTRTATGSPPREPSAAGADRPPPALGGIQAQVAPLLVWAAMAVRGAGQRAPLQALADNMRAWRIARRAAAGRYIDS